MQTETSRRKQTADSDIDRQAEEVFFEYWVIFSKKECVTETLKAEKQNAVMHNMNGLCNAAAKIVPSKIIRWSRTKKENSFWIGRNQSYSPLFCIAVQPGYTGRTVRRSRWIQTKHRYGLPAEKKGRHQRTDNLFLCGIRGIINFRL